VCPWLVPVSSERCIYNKRRNVLCVSQRVIGVKTAFWELRDTCNKRQAGSPPM
jgi:hypothetical protein